MIALDLDGPAGKDVPLSAEVWLPDGDGDSGPPAPAHTGNRPATPEQSRNSAAMVMATCVVCGAEQPATPFADPVRCPRCLAYLVVGDTQTRELGLNQLMRTPSLLVPLPAPATAVDWPRMSDHQNAVTVWADDGALGFRSYQYFRAFCEANRLGPAGD